MLDADLTSQLKGHLEKVTLPIELVASLDDGSKSAELWTLLEEIAALSPNVTAVRTEDAPDGRTPAFSIVRVGTDVSVRFAGIPMGHEFTSLVLALLQVGGHPPSVSEETAAAVQELEGSYEFVTYMSLSCQNCPDVVQALNAMSVLNSNISHTAVDGALFPAEVERHNVLAVPTVLLDGEPFDQGRMTLEQILGRLDTGMADRERERIDALDPFDVLVLGGGPAGAASAIYSARKGISTGILTERFGGQVLDTMGIENLISVPYTEGPKLAAALEAHVSEYEVDVMHNQHVERLVPAAEPGGLATVELDSGATVSARSVVISTGARWRALGVPGEVEYRNKGVTNCPHCDGPLFKGKPIAVVGGGNSGVEAAIDLAGIVGHVTLLEFMDDLLADDVLQAKLRSLDNVDVITGAATTEIVGDGERVQRLRYEDRASGEGHELELAGVFVQIGLLPNTEWLGDAVELSPRGEVVIDDRGATSAAGVFAGGDCTTAPYKQIVVALGAGATAALSAFDHLIRTSAPVPEPATEGEPVPA
ncbi:MAG: alkyl hydroperoxide reductase subunit F [Microthrixaceae bacterium]